MNLVTSWAEWLIAGGAAKGTVYLYERYIERISAVYDLLTVTTQELAGWFAAQTWSPSTRKSCSTAVRSFFKWAHIEGHRPDNPTHNLGRVKLPPPSPRPATDDVWEKALANEDPDVRLMVMLAGYAGLRRAEIAGLHSHNIEGDMLRVKGKGGRVRVVPIASDELLAELLARGDGWIFPGRFPGSHVCPDFVGKRLSKALGPGWTGHKLRHRFATRAFRGTHNLLAVQDLLGHTSPDTTRRYVLLDEDDLRAAARAAVA